MNELISISTGGQGSPVVSARELYQFLEVKSRFNDWFKNRVGRYNFIEGRDFITLTENSANEGFTKNLVKPPFSPISEKGGRPELDYALTLDMAKELSMVERNAKGKQARQYFIDCETRLREVATQPLGPAHKLLTEQARRISDLEQQMRLLLESQQQAARSLLDMPRSADPLPEETTRDHIRRIVNAYCRTKGVSQQDVWRRVYDRLYYLYRVSIRSYKRSERESWLDVADRSGHIDKIYAIVSAELHCDEG